MAAILSRRKWVNPSDSSTNILQNDITGAGENRVKESLHTSVSEINRNDTGEIDWYLTITKHNKVWGLCIEMHCIMHYSLKTDGW